MGTDKAAQQTWHRPARYLDSASWSVDNLLYGENGIVAEALKFIGQAVERRQPFLAALPLPLIACSKC
jgi:hypothetical protein